MKKNRAIAVCSPYLLHFVESAEEAEIPGNKYDGASCLSVVQTSVIVSVSNGPGDGVLSNFLAT